MIARRAKQHFVALSSRLDKDESDPTSIMHGDVRRQYVLEMLEKCQNEISFVRSIACMCRNIRILHHFEPPTTDDEIHEAALQYVRKVSGIQAPSKADQVAFAAAVQSIADATKHMLSALNVRGEPRTREGERAKAKVRWEKREAKIRS